MSEGVGRPAGEGAHLRWDEMAVGHVLGGLDDVDRALFRDHLTGCADCRARVAELREVATGLEHAAADEPDTQSAAGDGRAENARRGRRWKERRAALVTLVALATGLAGILWLLAAVGRDSELVTTARIREATLEALGSGAAADTTLAPGVRGIVVASDSEIAWSLTGLPDLADDERIVVWFTSVEDTDGEATITTSLLLFGPDHLAGGRLAGSILDAHSDEVLVTVETFPLPSRPSGPELVRADLPGER